MALGTFKLAVVAAVGCHPLPDGAVSPVPEGFAIHAFREVVPFDEVAISGDDRYWLCVMPNGQMELFVPPDPEIEYGVKDDEPSK